MSVFSTPAGSNLEESDGDKGNTRFELGGQNQSRPLSTSIVSEEKTVDAAPLSSASSGAEFDMSSTCAATRGYSRIDPAYMESTRAPIPTVAAATSAPHPNYGDLEFGLNTDRGGVVNDGENVGCSDTGGVVAQAPKTAVLVSSGLREWEIKEMEDSGITAADWQDVIHAVVGALHEPDQAGML